MNTRYWLEEGQSKSSGLSTISICKPIAPTIRCLLIPSFLLLQGEELKKEYRLSSKMKFGSYIHRYLECEAKNTDARGMKEVFEEAIRVVIQPPETKPRPCILL